MVMIGVLGSHSAEEVGVSAKSNGFKTVVVCQKGRENFYVNHNNFLYDYKIVLDKFSDLLDEENLDKLKKLGAVWLPNRSFSAYINPARIEKEFDIPIYGNRYMLKTESRALQYELLDTARIRRPRTFKPENIDCLTIVKAQQKNNPLERAFFYAKNYDDYLTKSAELVKKGVISEAGLKNCMIEEFIPGPRFNANFHAWAGGGFDFVGFDDRIQDNVSGILNLPAREQLKINMEITNEEAGHKGVTMRESKKPLVYDAAEKFLDAAKKLYPPGMIGMFSLQGALSNNEFVVFDVSPRIPGSPCVGPTSPEMRRLSIKYSKRIRSPLDLAMMDISAAGNVSEVTT